MVGAGNTCQAAYDYMKTTFDGQSPVIVIGSSGTLPTGMTFEGWKLSYYYDIIALIARESEAEYTEEDADDALDDVAQELMETLQANRKTADWQCLEFDGPSVPAPASVGGDPYWMEITPVLVHVY